MTERLDGDQAMPRVLMGVLLLILAASKGFSALLGALLPPPLLADGAVYYGFAIGQELIFFGLPAFLLRHRYPVLRWRTDASCPPSALILLGLIAALHQVTLQYLTHAWVALMQAMGLTLRVAAAPLPANVFQLILAGLGVMLLPALCEEGFFRGALYPGLSGVFTRRGGLVAVTLLFACLHGSAAALPAHLAAGLMLTLIMARTGSLTAAILYHCVYNGLSLLLSMTWSGWMMDIVRSPELFLIALTGLVAASMLSAHFFFKRRYVRPDHVAVRPDRPTAVLTVLALLLMACSYLVNVL